MRELIRERNVYRWAASFNLDFVMEKLSPTKGVGE